jgi:hypothetical protein
VKKVSYLILCSYKLKVRDDWSVCVGSELDTGCGVFLLLVAVLRTSSCKVSEVPDGDLDYISPFCSMNFSYYSSLYSTNFTVKVT